ncbi:phospho-N-acetylmuramoyl-pentapeptide-transferase [Desulfitispora alkaliphila]|uniref:phospho-N-acetylmuramoyl-pentapeptide- transferase n=1 Tax=Desulfitispora alkaliphila TaxID=622674 RepID=UPI003D20C497
MEKVIIAFIVALVIGILVGPVLIPILRKLKFGQYVRDDGPKSHIKKAGTPTMGGVIFLIAIITSVLIVSELNAMTIIALVVTVGYGLIGFLDDFIKVVLKRSLGLRAKEKLFGQILLAFTLAWVTGFYLDRGTEVIVPFTQQTWDLGILYLPFVIIVVVGTTNAVNLTDGLDGLATGITFFVALGLIFLSILAGEMDMAYFSAALAGGCLAFLRYNSYPAKVFMGDTGSLALGGAIAAVAVITKTELFLPIIGGVFVVEAISVIVQVIAFKLTGKRIFRMSPIHHHFELGGWHERKVVRYFWIAAFVLVVVGILAF